MREAYFLRIYCMLYDKYSSSLLATLLSFVGTSFWRGALLQCCC
uniref:Uncharacterized protein n=1 Tax=Anguilla anguilla TaxID=7936 RepID=A0A0E9PL20_ANGAN